MHSTVGEQKTALSSTFANSAIFFLTSLSIIVLHLATITSG